MFGKSLKVAPVILGLGVAVATIGTGEAGSSAGPLRCEIEATEQGSMVSLAAVVHSDAPLGGSYRFKVESAGGGGGSNISQGGNFSAGPGAPAMLGRVSLGGNSIYDATLEVTADGLIVECDERIGGSL
jgi:hypothetical protein